MKAEANPELEGLKENAAMLERSIAQRKERGAKDAGLATVLANEEARLAEIQARIKELEK